MPGPVVTNISPDPSVPILFDTPISFDVTDASNPFRAIVVMAKFTTGAWEVVYDGIAFGPNYSTLSTKVSILNGFTFRLRRDGGWPGVAASLTLDIQAIDTAGAENP